MKRVYTLLLVLSGVVVVVCGPSDVRVVQQPTGTSASSALTASECAFFDVDGSVRICHATGSEKNPYAIIQVSGAACVNAHSTHPGDYVATAADLDCQDGGCFPAGAPVDPTIPCCEGLVADGGVCSGGSDGGTGDGGGTGGTGDGGTGGTGDGGTGGTGDGGTGGTGDGGTGGSGDGGTGGTGDGGTGGTGDGGTGGTGDGGTCNVLPDGGCA